MNEIKDYEGIIKSIKGQYIIFKNGDVLNIRKHTGYEIIIEYNLKMPISNSIYNILYKNLSPKEAIMDLMSRDLTHENN